ncbi:MAG: 1,4-dihydroxy-2-naphthoate octaprenyltransferase [Elusimicrobiota bacterium]|nr:1,4-dihydroxy-2-naphthoate octaprenyltransferase [Elusimicrobiota bacterium]
MMIKLWIRAIRAPFFTATIIPVLLGTVIAWTHTGQALWMKLLLTLIGVICVHAGTNLMNDYYDHKSKNDDLNLHPTAFSGGSRMIQQGLISAKRIFYSALIFFALGSVVGLYLNWVSKGNIILFLGLAGVLLGFFYTAEPLRIGYTGIGELAVGFGFGPLIVSGAYYIQAQRLSLEPLLASIPIGILIMLVLYINEFPDYEADKLVNKRTWIVKLGKERAIKIYYLLLALVYLTIVVGIIFRFLPLFSVLTFVTLPLSLKAVIISWKNYDKIETLLPVNAITIKLHSIIGLLLIMGYFFDKLLLR